MFKCLPTSILSLWQELLNFESDLLWVKGISNTKYLSTISNYLKKFTMIAPARYNKVVKHIEMPKAAP